MRRFLRCTAAFMLCQSVLVIPVTSLAVPVSSSEIKVFPSPQKAVPNMIVRASLPSRLDRTQRTDGNFSAGSGSNDSAYEIAVQSDGKIVAVGSVSVSENNDEDFAVFRYNADGSLDPSFGGDGQVSTSFSNCRDAALAVAIQIDGKIVAAGVSTDEKGSWFAALARFNTDGSLDTSFGSGGKVISEGADIGGIVIQPDGKIIADGGGSWVIRYNDDGSLDTSFGTGGFTTAGFGVWAVALQSDGKIVAAGDNYCDDGDCVRDFALARFNADGSLDTSFDSDGWLTTRFEGASSVASSLILQPDGKIVAAGYDAEKLAVARYNADGSLDASFDGDGKFLRPVGLVNWDPETATALQSDGSIIVCGSMSDDGQDFDFALVRLQTDGSLDTSFDADGKLTTDFGGGEDYAFDVALQPNGKIVAGGFATMATRDFALARYDPDGSLDTTFDVDGRVTTSFNDAVSVGGRVLTPGGQSIRNATVVMADSQGFVRTATTSSFGNYLFEGVYAGPTYTLTVRSKRYRFTPRTLVITGTLTGIDLVGLE
jgi:uncharacterized delta-60 repeat protein